MSASRPEIETDDAIVLLLGAPTKNPHLRNRLSGITRLEKLLFLLEQDKTFRGVLTESPDFEANNFGPFSKKIYQSVELLEAAGLLRETTREAQDNDDLWEGEELIGVIDAPAFTEREFELTGDGRDYFRTLEQLVPEAGLQSVSAIKDRLGGLPLRQLIRYVYQSLEKDPSQRHLLEHSTIRDDILGPK